MKKATGIAYVKLNTFVVSCDTYSVTVTKGMVATICIRSKGFNLTNRNPLVQYIPCQRQPTIKEILRGTTSSGISYQLRDIFSICRCCWNDATYKWKDHNGKIEIISFVLKFVS